MADTMLPLMIVVKREKTPLVQMDIYIASIWANMGLDNIDDIWAITKLTAVHASDFFHA